MPKIALQMHTRSPSRTVGGIQSRHAHQSDGFNVYLVSSRSEYDVHVHKTVAQERAQR